MPTFAYIFLILATCICVGQVAATNDEAMALTQKLTQQTGALEVILIGLFKFADAGEMDLETRKELIRTIQRIAQYINLVADTLEELLKYPEEDQGLGPNHGASASLDGIGEEGMNKTWLSWLIDVVG